jgi:hypothetical protein
MVNCRDITVLQGRDTTIVAEGDDILIFIPIAEADK